MLARALHADTLSPSIAFTTALQQIYYRFITALLPLYYCIPTALLIHYYFFTTPVLLRYYCFTVYYWVTGDLCASMWGGGMACGPPGPARRLRQ